MKYNSLEERMKELTDFSKIKITNDYMFYSVFKDKDDCKELLQRVLGIEISELIIVDEQKSIKTTSENKGIRLDLYVKDVDGNIYDIEMQASDDKDISLRSRYYHSEMDNYALKQGKKYFELQKSIVIFICMNDYFEKGRSIYSFQSICEEDKSIYLGDKRTTIFLYINGNRDGLRKELSNLLDYFQTSNPTDDFTKNIENKVDKNRQDTEWRDNFVHLSMKFEEKYQEGLERGIAEGMEQGIAYAIVTMGKEFGLPDDEIIKRIVKEADMDEITAKEFFSDISK